MDIPTQQSANLCQLLPFNPVARQLFDPQTRLPAQSLSVSQSPSLILHWLEGEQQDQSVVGIPSQFGATVGAGVVVVVVAVDVANFKSIKDRYPECQLILKFVNDKKFLIVYITWSDFTLSCWHFNFKSTSWNRVVTMEMKIKFVSFRDNWAW